jgi:molybdopterin molybdotransferase
MISLQEAKQLVLEEARSFGKEIILLEDALGRTLNEAVIADRDYPPFNRATMDGIAINSADWNEGIRSFTLVETIFAGQASTKSIGNGECYKIMTGAAVPLSADTVIRREDIEADENRLTITVSPIVAGQNIAAKGSDIKAGTSIVHSAQRIKPGTITTLASLGYAEVKVASLPSIAIITTGDEIVPVDVPANDVQIRNSNAFLLKAMLQQWQIRTSVCKHLKDDAAILSAAVKQLRNHDVIILSGAVSAGDADFVPEVLINAGAKKIFHKVAIRPGKPIWFGKFDNGPIVFALPGNPFSTFVTFKLFIEPFLQQCFGLPVPTTLQLPFSGSRIKKTNLDEFFPVMISGNPTVATAIPFNTSGDITAVMEADAIAMQPIAATEITAGDIISCMIV